MYIQCWKTSSAFCTRPLFSLRFALFCARSQRMKMYATNKIHFTRYAFLTAALRRSEERRSNAEKTVSAFREEGELQSFRNSSLRETADGSNRKGAVPKRVTLSQTFRRSEAGNGTDRIASATPQIPSEIARISTRSAGVTKSPINRRHRAK